MPLNNLETQNASVRITSSTRAFKMHENVDCVTSHCRVILQRPLQLFVGKDGILLVDML